MFPMIKNIPQTQTSEEYLGISYEFDFKKGEHIIVDGKMIECNLQKNIEQFIEVVLKTTQNKFKIYSENFGISITKKIGEKRLQGIIVAETKREIIENLQKNPAIQSVENFKFKHIDATLYISFEVFLKNNEKFVYAGSIDKGGNINV